MEIKKVDFLCADIYKGLNMNLYNSNFFVFSFLKEKIENITEFIKNLKTQEIKFSYGNYTIEDIFEKNSCDDNVYQLPKNANNIKSIIYKNSISDGTVYISNIPDGWFMQSKYIAKEMNIPFYYFRISIDGITESINQFYFIDYSLDIPLERVVYAMQDPKWIFYESGKPLFFENTNYYINRIKKKRINKNIITEYCKKIDLDIQKDDFWISSGESILLEDNYKG